MHEQKASYFSTFYFTLVLNPCEVQPCNNGGICKVTGATYECQCQAGFQGDNCETEINECESSPCYGGASCLDKVSYFCKNNFYT